MPDNFDSYVEYAIQWAQAHLGAEEYSTRCLAFVEDAYECSNHIEIFGGSTAKESAVAYEVCGAGEQPPPLGAFVFYDCNGYIRAEYRNWGHVGLCVGLEQVIHAWDRVRQDHYLEVQQLTPGPGWHKPQYIGWAPVARFMIGHRTKA